MSYGYMAGGRGWSIPQSRGKSISKDENHAVDMMRILFETGRCHKCEHIKPEKHTIELCGIPNHCKFTIHGAENCQYYKVPLRDLKERDMVIKSKANAKQYRQNVADIIMNYNPRCETRGE